MAFSSLNSLLLGNKWLPHIILSQSPWGNSLIVTWRTVHFGSLCPWQKSALLEKIVDNALPSPVSAVAINLYLNDYFYAENVVKCLLGLSSNRNQCKGLLTVFSKCFLSLNLFCWNEILNAS